MKNAKMILVLLYIILLLMLCTSCHLKSYFEGTSSIGSQVTCETSQVIDVETSTVSTEDVSLESWKLYLQEPLSGTVNEISWIEEQIESDFSEWFTDYNGEDLHKIPAYMENSWTTYYGPSTCPDIVYYRADADENLQDILNHMIDAMLMPLMEPVDGRPYTVTKYVLEEHPLVQIKEDMWLVKYLNGYYSYEGTEFVTMDVRIQNEKIREDGLVSFSREGTPDVFHYILFEKDGVYRLQLASDMWKMQ